MGGYSSVGPGSSWQAKKYFNHTIDTTNLVNGEPFYYYFGLRDSVIDNISDFGLLYVAKCNNITIRNLYADNRGIHLVESEGSCTIENCTVTMTTDASVDCCSHQGIKLDISHNTTIKNCTINLTGTGPPYGIYSDSSHYCIYDNNTVIVSGGSSRAHHLYANYKSIIKNSYYTASGTDSMALSFYQSPISGDGNEAIDSKLNGKVFLITASQGNKFINTTYSSIQFGVSTSIKRYWYLDVKVTDSTGNPIAGAIVTAIDKNGTETFSTTTGQYFRTDQKHKDYEEVSPNLVKKGETNET